MPISLSQLRQRVGGAIGGGGGGATGRGVVIRGGRAFKLVPAGAKIRHKPKFHAARTSRMDKMMEMALIIALVRSATH